MQDLTYRNSKEEEIELHKGINDEILELKTDFETFYKLIDENIEEKSSPFYDIMNESSNDKVGALMSDLYARFMFIIVQIMISEYQNLLENNAQETRQSCTKFLSDQLSDNIEKKFIHDTRFGISEFHDSMRLLREYITIPLCNEFPEWDGTICKEQTIIFEREMVGYF